MWQHGPPVNEQWMMFRGAHLFVHAGNRQWNMLFQPTEIQFIINHKQVVLFRFWNLDVLSLSSWERINRKMISLKSVECCCNWFRNVISSIFSSFFFLVYITKVTYKETVTEKKMKAVGIDILESWGDWLLLLGLSI